MNKRMVYILSVLSILIVGVVSINFFGGGIQPVKNDLEWTESGDKLKVVTAFYPLYDFTEQIGGDLVQVVNLVPAGGEPHDFELKSQAVRMITEADAFVYQSLALQPWVVNLRSILGENKENSDNVSSEAVMIEAAIDIVDKADVHVWLDLDYAATQTARIASELIKLDPVNATIYEEKASNYQSALSNLNQQFALELSNCMQKDVISTHQVLYYPAKKYGFTAHGINNLSSHDAPSANRLMGIVDLIKEKNIKYILIEPRADMKMIETLVKETGVKTLVYNPLETLTLEEIAAGKNYIEVQKENLISLKMALECQK